MMTHLGELRWQRGEDEHDRAVGRRVDRRVEPAAAHAHHLRYGAIGNRASEREMGGTYIYIYIYILFLYIYMYFIF